MRGKRAPRRKIVSDPKFASSNIAKLINYVMADGKKSVAQRVVYAALALAEEKTKRSGADVFEDALKNVYPTLEVKSKRVGGANYQVPLQVRAERRLQLALRWIVNAARSRKGKPMAEKLSFEILEAAQNQGDAVKKKLDVQRMAEANRAFAHFAR